MSKIATTMKLGEYSWMVAVEFPTEIWMNINLIPVGCYWCEVNTSLDNGFAMNRHKTMKTKPIRNVWLQCGLRIIPQPTQNKAFREWKHPSAHRSENEQPIDTVRPRQNCHHCAHDIFKWIFLDENGKFSDRTIYLQNVPTGHWYHSYIVSCSSTLSESTRIKNWWVTMWHTLQSLVSIPVSDGHP